MPDSKTLSAIKKRVAAMHLPKPRKLSRADIITLVASFIIALLLWTYIAANVPPNCFMPRPNVGSAVIRLTNWDKPPVEVKDERLMFKLIRASFNQRRKTLQNGINNSPELSFTKEQVVEALKKLGINENIRGEALTLEQFADLSNILS